MLVGRVGNQMMTSYTEKITGRKTTSVLNDPGEVCGNSLSGLASDSVHS